MGTTIGIVFLDELEALKKASAKNALAEKAQEVESEEVQADNTPAENVKQAERPKRSVRK